MIVPGSASPLLTTTDGGYTIAKSLRFRSSASAYLNRTPASAGNRKTWTWSGWIKRGQFVGGMYQGYVSTSSFTAFGWGGTGASTLFMQDFVNGSYNLVWETSALFRDPASWYHVIFAYDSTQASSANALKLYVNGVQQTLGFTAVSGAYVQNRDSFINATNSQQIGTYSNNVFYDGYMTEVNFIDGQALTPSSFGETDSVTGVWKPKAYSGTYGTNGFYLKFTDVATTSGSNAGLGKDFSGNGNYWTTNNISVTSGATYDSMTDVPTLTSDTAANYAVINPLMSGGTISDGNLKAVFTSGSVFGSMAATSGKTYFECTVTSAGSDMWFGVVQSIANVSPSTSGNWTASQSLSYRQSGDKNNGTNSSYGSSWTTGDVLACALDIDAGSITFYKNGTSQGVAFSSGVSGFSWIPFFYTFSVAATVNWNFGQRPFAYTPPTGFKALNTYNLPDSTIVAGNKYMDATTYTGTGSAITVTNSGGFKPDFVWVKARSFSSGGVGHMLADSVRGGTKVLHTDQTAAEQTNLYGAINTFNSNGFTTLAGSTNSAEVHDASMTYVGWQWQAGQGSTSSNTNGSITSTVSVNPTAGFSIITYTGTAVSNATVGHGLGVAPAMVFVKNRTTAVVATWRGNHKGLTAAYNINLNTTDAQFSLASGAGGGVGALNNSSTFTLANGTVNNDNVNQSGVSYVAYCWSEIAGFSKFGSYTGNGSTDGPFIYLGFRPKFFLVKRTDTTNDWVIFDSARNLYNSETQLLYPNLSDAEFTNTASVDFVSNGFKLRSGAGAWNINSGNYIYAAFAETPQKLALAR